MFRERKIATIIFVTGMFFLLPVSIPAQGKREWIRVQTNDDSIVEINRTELARIGEGQVRATFRQTYRQLQRFGRSNIQFISQVELFEFDCVNHQSRPQAVLYLNRAGRVVHYRGADGLREWKPSSGHYYQAACGLLASLDAPVRGDQPDPNAKRATLLAANFWRRLTVTRDITPLLPQYFARDFLDRMGGTDADEWRARLTPATVSRMSATERVGYFAAVFNAQFLGSMYVIVKSNAGADPTAPGEAVVSPAVLRAVDQHPYSLKYRRSPHDYAYLAETIDTVERARDYVALLETTNKVLNRELGRRIPTHLLKEYEQSRDQWQHGRLDVSPDVRICEQGCYRLPADSRIYAVDLPVGQLQIADVSGRLRIVSVAIRTPE